LDTTNDIYMASLAPWKYINYSLNLTLDLADIFFPHTMPLKKNSLLYVPTWHVFCSGVDAQTNMHQYIDTGFNIICGTD
jgi:hypothetical protein